MNTDKLNTKKCINPAVIENITTGLHAFGMPMRSTPLIGSRSPVLSFNRKRYVVFLILIQPIRRQRYHLLVISVTQLQSHTFPFRMNLRKERLGRFRRETDFRHRMMVDFRNCNGKTFLNRNCYIFWPYVL